MNHGNRLVWGLTTATSVLAMAVMTVGPGLSSTQLRQLALEATAPFEGASSQSASSSHLRPLGPLAEVAGSAQRLVIQHDGNDWLQLARKDEEAGNKEGEVDWKIASLAQWPARQDKVTALLEALAEAKIRAGKPASAHSLAALGLTADSPVVVVGQGEQQVRLQLGDRPTAAPVEGEAAKPLEGRYVRWLSDARSSDGATSGAGTLKEGGSRRESPVLELTRDIGLPDWRGGMADAEVLNLVELLKRSRLPSGSELPSISGLPSRVEVTLANEEAVKEGAVRDSSLQTQALAHALAPQGGATRSLMAALSPLKQNDLRLRAAPRSSDVKWQPAVTLTLHWESTRPDSAADTHAESEASDQRLRLEIAAGSKPWARLTLIGPGWPAALVARLDEVEIQVNGALRARLMALSVPVLPIQRSAPLLPVSVQEKDEGQSDETG